LLNLDFSRPITIPARDEEWQNGASAGVSFKRLAYSDQRHGHATSIVRIDAGTLLAEHDHPAGEEVFVLDGAVSDENGHYGSGTYIRNPPGYLHTPYTESGCTLFVKLNQFSDGDTTRIVLDTDSTSWHPGHGALKVKPLHSFAGENTALVNWPAGEKFIAHQHFGGEEIFVLTGEFIDEHGRYPAGTWIRSPHLSAHHPWVEEETVIFVKTGHL